MNFNKQHARIHKLYLGGGVKTLISKFLWRCIRIVYHVDVSYKLDLSGVYLCHNGFGTVINPETRIGKGTVIQHSVTIGEMDGSHKCPIIGENVFIGARSIILGNIRIGNNVKIGAGAIVINDVPDNCTVVGVPAHVIKKEKNEK